MGVDKIIGLVGVIVALVAGAIGGFAYSDLAIVVLGLVGGYFIADEDRPRVYMATVALYVVGQSAGLDVIPAIGSYLQGALGGLGHLFAAGAATAVVMATIDRVKP